MSNLIALKSMVGRYFLECLLYSNDEELKFLLYGIEQRFYTTILGDEKRLANSIQTLG